MSDYIDRDNREMHELDESVFIDVNLDFETYTERIETYQTYVTNPDNTEPSKSHKLNKDDLQDWAISHNITHVALNSLLRILRQSGHQDLPCDARTILKTPREIKIDQLDNGRYWHTGLTNSLRNLFSNLSESKLISLVFNIDGLPVGDSTTNQFWPILALIYEMPHIKPFIIGIYEGDSKPSVIEEFLTPFIRELIEVMQNGIKINNHTLSINIRCFVCDTPARSFIKGTYFSGFLSVSTVLCNNYFLLFQSFIRYCRI